jgi:cullin-4
MALGLFRAHVLSHEQVLHRTISGVLDVIGRERAGDDVNRGQIKQLLGMLSELGLYKEQFEVPFLRQSNIFYESESSQYLEQCETADYLLYAEKKLNEERDRADQYLDDVTRKPLTNAVEMQLIIVNLDSICKGLDTMLDGKRHDDLGRLYTLLGRVDGHKYLHGSFVDFIKKRGKVIVGNVAKDKTMVEDLLEFKQQIDDVVFGPWQKNKVFVNGVREAFSDFINSRHNKPAEMIAQFFDAKLRKGYKELTEEKLDEIFDRVMVLFRFINGKDVFEAFYKTHLARRLLLQKSASNDAERSILSKLKQECGSQFTGKLEGMFKDVDRSIQLTLSFKQMPGASFGTDIDLHVNVLTASHWPTYSPKEVVLPEKIQEMQAAFTTFYCNTHSNRKLTWENSLGHCTVEGQFPKGVKDLQISAWQGIILLCFNSEEVLTCQKLHEMTKIEMSELKRVLQSLACSKVRVLAKSPKGKDVETTDRFIVNQKFENKHRRVKINQIQLKETAEENTATQEKVFQDRIFSVDAAVVRTMKARKKIKHTMLISELFEQLKFPVAASDLKKRIESLINREYIARDSNDSQLYEYIA